jgi:hypothetical protein
MSVGIKEERSVERYKVRHYIISVMIILIEIEIRINISIYRI